MTRIRRGLTAGLILVVQGLIGVGMAKADWQYTTWGLVLMK